MTFSFRVAMLALGLTLMACGDGENSGSKQESSPTDDQPKQAAHPLAGSVWRSPVENACAYALKLEGGAPVQPFAFMKVCEADATTYHTMGSTGAWMDRGSVIVGENLAYSCPILRLDGNLEMVLEGEELIVRFDGFEAPGPFRMKRVPKTDAPPSAPQRTVKSGCLKADGSFVEGPWS